MNEFEKNLTIQAADVDCYQRLKLSRLYLMMQEMAAEHAHALGLGRTKLLKDNLIFVLSRVGMDILHMPGLNEKIKLITYPNGTDKLFFVRDFEMYCGQQLFAKARTLWLLIDKDRRRPVRYQKMDDALLETRENKIRHPEKLKPALTGEKKNEIAIGYSHIDTNGHVNHTHYVDWISDALKKSFFENDPSYTMTICFTKEVMENQKIHIYKNGSDIEGKVADQTVFTSKVER